MLDTHLLVDIHLYVFFLTLQSYSTTTKDYYSHLPMYYIPKPLSVLVCLLMLLFLSKREKNSKLHLMHTQGGSSKNVIGYTAYFFTISCTLYLFTIIIIS